MPNIYELEGQYFVIKNGVAFFQMVIAKSSTIVLMDLGLSVPASGIELDKAKKYTFQELKKKLL